MDEENYVINKDAMDFALKLHEASLQDTFNIGNSLLKSVTKERDELSLSLTLANGYIDYVEDCIKLYAVPRDYNFWYKFIR